VIFILKNYFLQGMDEELNLLVGCAILILAYGTSLVLPGIEKEENLLLNKIKQKLSFFNRRFLNVDELRILWILKLNFYISYFM